ncbi:hypothetical protein KI387_026300, partial [Taxus chinensis]
VKDPNKKSWMQAIYDSGLVLVTDFPTSMHCPEFILAKVAHFDEDSRMIKDVDSKVVIGLDSDLFEDLFKLPD